MLRNAIASNKATFGTKLGVFVVRSSLLQAGYSFWPKRSGTTT